MRHSPALLNHFLTDSYHFTTIYAPGQPAPKLHKPKPRYLRHRRGTAGWMKTAVPHYFTFDWDWRKTYHDYRFSFKN
ncbi:hypothetical protein HMPREF1548_03461 [Clostridium sp. KLE 1755]|nr:hypothetical protein HMPREF1548_03461 [Clostridium sp. KLE 1755]